MIENLNQESVQQPSQLNKQELSDRIAFIIEDYPMGFRTGDSDTINTLEQDLYKKVPKDYDGVLCPNKGTNEKQYPEDYY